MQDVGSIVLCRFGVSVNFIGSQPSARSYFLDCAIVAIQQLVGLVSCVWMISYVIQSE